MTNYNHVSGGSWLGGGGECTRVGMPPGIISRQGHPVACNTGTSLMPPPCSSSPSHTPAVTQVTYLVPSPLGPYYGRQDTEAQR